MYGLKVFMITSKRNLFCFSFSLLFECEERYVFDPTQQFWKPSYYIEKIEFTKEFEKFRDCFSGKNSFVLLFFSSCQFFFFFFLGGGVKELFSDRILIKEEYSGQFLRKCQNKRIFFFCLRILWIIIWGKFKNNSEPKIVLERKSEVERRCEAFKHYRLINNKPID